MRKKPTQQRAEKTVEIISEAAIQLLDTPVSPDFTTNHIAERAGVSVGTLYRYFPDKGAILRHIVRQELEMLREGLEEIIDSSDAKDAQNLLREVLEHTVHLRSKSNYSFIDFAQGRLYAMLSRSSLKVFALELSYN